MASLKYFAAFLLTLELVAAVRPAQHELDLEKPTLAKHESHGHESKLTQIERVEAVDHADTERKPCCGCKVKSFLGLGRSCDGKVGSYLMETCAGERGQKMRRPFQNEWGRIFMLDKHGWMQSRSLLIAIVSSPARHDHGLAKEPRAPPFSESTKISFAELNLRLQKEEEGKCEGVLLVSLSSCSSFAASFLFVRGSH